MSVIDRFPDLHIFSLSLKIEIEFWQGQVLLVLEQTHQFYANNGFEDDEETVTYSRIPSRLHYTQYYNVT